MDRSIVRRVEVLCLECNQWICPAKSEFIEDISNGKIYTISWNPRLESYTFTENYKLILTGARSEEILEAIENISNGNIHTPSEYTRKMSIAIGIKLAYS